MQSHRSSAGGSEADRLAALQRYRILGTPRDAAFDRITALAARIFGVPFSCGSLVDADRVWMKSAFGLEGVDEVPRQPGLCATTVEGSGVHHVADAATDPRTKENDLATGEFGLRFYAGVPLRTPDDFHLGTLCVFGREPRGLEDAERRILEDLAELAMREIDQHRAAIELAEAEAQQRTLHERLSQAKKLESLGLLASGIAHDFNNMLVGVVGNVDVAQRIAPVDSPLRDCLDRIELSATRASELCDQMLAYAGGRPLEMRALDMSALVAETVELTRPSVGAEIEFRCSLEADLPSVDGDSGQLRQVVMNLLFNAAQATAGRGVVQVTTGSLLRSADDLASPWISEPRPAGEYVFVAIEDGGCGMDADTVNRLFDPFFTTKPGGRGLGLAVTLGVVRAHGGVIQVESEPARGTRLTVLLRSAGRAHAPVPVVEDAVACRGSGVVLYVDDEAAVLELGSEMLHEVGFRVVTARDGAEALAKFEKDADSFTAVVLDLSMPGMHGLDLLGRLRELRPDLPVVISSGYDEAHVGGRVGVTERTQFVKKPFRMRQLAAKLQRAIG